MGVITFRAAWLLLLMVVLELMGERFRPCAGEWEKEGDPVQSLVSDVVMMNIQKEVFKKAAKEEKPSRWKENEERRNVEVEMDGVQLSMMQYPKYPMGAEDGYAISEVLHVFCSKAPNGSSTFEKDAGFARKFQLSVTDKEFQLMSNLGGAFAREQPLTSNELRSQCSNIATVLEIFLHVLAEQPLLKGDNALGEVPAKADCVAACAFGGEGGNSGAPG